MKGRSLRLKIERNARQRMSAAAMLQQIKNGEAALAIVDPQYRAVLDKLKFGNEGARQGARAKLPQMTDDDIAHIVEQIERVLCPSGHLMLWADKFTIASGHHLRYFARATTLRLVDLIAWNKLRPGMGRRSRGVTEFVVVLQKEPTRAKGVWTDHALRDCWLESADRAIHPHAKPHVLTERLIRAVTKRGDLVVDPCAGGYGVLEACRASGREFVGCDLI